MVYHNKIWDLIVNFLIVKTFPCWEEQNNYDFENPSQQWRGCICLKQREVGIGGGVYPWQSRIVKAVWEPTVAANAVNLPAAIRCDEDENFEDKIFEKLWRKKGGMYWFSAFVQYKVGNPLGKFSYADIATLHYHLMVHPTSCEATLLQVCTTNWHGKKQMRIFGEKKAWMIAAPGRWSAFKYAHTNYWGRGVCTSLEWKFQNTWLWRHIKNRYLALPHRRPQCVFMCE